MIAACDSAWLAALSIPQLQQELALAASQLASAHLAEARNGWSAQCHECGASSREDLLHILHRDGCRTGRVARVLFALAETFQTPTGKETTQEDSQGGAARETRPYPLPFLVVGANALPGMYGEPWAMDAAGVVHDAQGNAIADPVGCELVEPDDRRAFERIAACVNYCNGIATRDLTRIGGAM